MPSGEWKFQTCVYTELMSGDTSAGAISRRADGFRRVTGADVTIDVELLAMICNIKKNDLSPPQPGSDKQNDLDANGYMMRYDKMLSY